MSQVSTAQPTGVQENGTEWDEAKPPFMLGGFAVLRDRFFDRARRRDAGGPPLITVSPCVENDRDKRRQHADHHRDGGPINFKNLMLQTLGLGMSEAWLFLLRRSQNEKRRAPHA